MVDVIVIGAGVFGAWTAWHLRERGHRVLLVDGRGPAHTQASSGGETRILRCGYGADSLYTEWACRALTYWRDLSARSPQPLVIETGVLFCAAAGDRHTTESMVAFDRLGIAYERLTSADLARRYPQFDATGLELAVLECRAAAVMARRAVQTVVDEFVARGGEYRQLHVTGAPLATDGGVVVATTEGPLRAGATVCACGPWLPRLMPDLLRDRIFPTRQDVFFFGTPPGDHRYDAAHFPAWIDFDAGIYGIPDIDHRGFKLAIDDHGPICDPETLDRIVAPESVERVRAFLGRRFPTLARAPIVETRVCQYENTWNGDLLIDRHPEASNVWIVGGGSGHGFKHGPIVGEYVAERLASGEREPIDPRFALAGKRTVRERLVH